MEFKFLIVFFNFIIGSASFSEKPENHLSIAFVNLTNVLIETNRDFSVLYFFENQKLIEKLLFSSFKLNDAPKWMNSSRIILSGEENQINTDQKYRVKEFAILVFDSMESLTDFHIKAVMFNYSPKAFIFYVYCHTVTPKDILSLGEMNELKTKFFIVILTQK